MTWNYCDSNWCPRNIQVASINLSTDRKTGAQLYAFMEETLSQSPINWSEKIHIFTATSENEASDGLSMDMLTNHVKSFRCVVQTISLCFDQVIADLSQSKSYINHVNLVKTYFSLHQKAAQMLGELQREGGVKNDRVESLKKDLSKI